MAKGFKTGGRKKGTPNKTTTELRETLTDFMLNEFKNIEERINSLAPKERLHLMVKLMPYVMPRAIEQMNYEDVTITLHDVQPTTYQIVDANGKPTML